MKRFGLIGHPISHSLSPVLFKKMFPEEELQYDLIESSSFEEAFRRFKEGDYIGINVTSPFKERAYQAADRPTQICRVIEASNLLLKESGHISAYNTDRDGVMFSLWKGLEKQINSGHWKVDIAKKGEPLKALVIGCGGAGRAAAISCLKMGFQTSITNRSKYKCDDFISNVSEHHSTFPISVPFAHLQQAIDDNHIIVYTIPEAVEQLYHVDFSGKIILEANYKDPAITPDMIKKTTLYIGGKEWLYHQAVATWKRFGLIS